MAFKEGFVHLFKLSLRKDVFQLSQGAEYNNLQLQIDTANSSNQRGDVTWLSLLLRLARKGHFMPMCLWRVDASFCKNTFYDKG